jgi:hypothetical protein
MGRIANCKSVLDIGFRVHVPNLLNDIILNQLRDKSGILRIPMNQFQSLLKDVAQRATELNDPELNILMLSLALYEVDPHDIPDEINNQISLMNK